MDLSTWLKSKHPEIPVEGALAVLRLAAEGGTVPFIARYRKEQTGNLDEVQIQTSLDAKERYDAIVKRQAFIVEEIERQKKLTPELRDVSVRAPAGLWRRELNELRFVPSPGGEVQVERLVFARER